MKIKAVRAYLRNLALRKPYSIAGYTFSEVENVFLEVELANGIVGIGAASPAEEVVGETCGQTLQNCNSDFFQHLVGRDIRHFRPLIDEVKSHFPQLPGTQAALDIALHDAFGQFLGLPVVEFYGQKIKALPTSVTIGLMSAEDTLKEAAEYLRLGFKAIKVKTGEDVEQDIERMLKLSETLKNKATIRVDANQGYSLNELKQFLKATQEIDIELVEQPLPVGEDRELLSLKKEERQLLTADESLKDAPYALQLAQQPQPFGIFNIKLMKCGGIMSALEIANIARHANIALFWGCNDESIVSITAALHAAFACPNTRYLDLDGSFDLAEDVVSGGFVLENGYLRLNGKPGLGLDREQVCY
ncbi:mandelate racemase/muconate lactonizing enzyme family protein [Runella slithyformis]|uniref:Dipeptide epimerase n=1 Tax=Runella slithyformis (strain ATCC 29530 / DSM 19594 / LMG 11500 / NCIMB 11436 / LSU 4) TaxID=761193 RepID=A0A7U3ZG98_RUNSL|nr:dipeptide epimerase [Runella slithyformis]AEI46665.1 Chloromuconate cycloisomerase [Runella slithyformis DSM 19594]